MRQRSEEIFVRVNRNGFIPQLGISGPIPNPIKITRGIAHSMVVAGIDVHEVNPETKEMTKLTIENVFAEDTKKEAPVQKATATQTANPVTPVTLQGVKKEEKKSDETASTTPKVEKTEETKSDNSKKENNNKSNNDKKK